MMIEDYKPLIEDSLEEGQAITIEKREGRMRIVRVIAGELSIVHGDTIPAALAELENALRSEESESPEVQGG